jgi:rhamnose utilization protein RhaD (predicted bifunctional aldolase and dehydrogenase)
MSIQALIEVSRRYGGDPDFVVAGGGNTSWKTAEDLYIKGSGVALESVTEDGFVRMDRKKLSAIWTASYPADPDARESAVLADMMAARRPGEEHKRPSVETLLHDVLPAAFVVHTHPALVNGISCSAREEAAAAELFGDEALWIPSTNPGYILSQIVADAYDAHEARTGRPPAFIILQNHGVFVAADTVAEIDRIYARLVGAIKAKIRRIADFSPVPLGAADGKAAAEASAALARLGAADAGPAAVHFAVDAEIARLVADGAPSPSSLLRSPRTTSSTRGATPVLRASRRPGRRLWGLRSPVQAAAQARRGPGLGVFGLGSGGNEKSARLAVELFRDAAKIAAYTEAFGGPRYMTADQVDFINNWEVERYRSKISTENERGMNDEEDATTDQHR